MTSENRGLWLSAVSMWAKQANARVVAGLSKELRTNELVIADKSGEIVVTYLKQHPAPGEPKPARRMPPALLQADPFPVSAVICIDLDYSDLVRPVGRAGGVLAVPVHDWDEIFEMHHRSAVWAAVMAGVPVVRSSGHGISAVYDAAGRVIARANSKTGPVVLVADAPISQLAVTARQKYGRLVQEIGRVPQETLAGRAATRASRADAAETVQLKEETLIGPRRA